MQRPAKLQKFLSPIRRCQRLASTESSSSNFSPKKTLKTRQKSVDFVAVEGEMLYGINPVAMALEAGSRKFYQVYFNEASKRTSGIVNSAKQRGIRCTRVDRQVLNQLARHSCKEVGVHQGVCADVEKLLPEIFQMEDIDKNDG
jgi:tRNA G18 (ribose-2'-O)-methylase SpoU